MSIFRSRDPEPQKPTPPSAPSRPAPRSPSESVSPDRTHIAAGSKVVGEVSGSAELVIDGRVEGRINLESRVVIGPKGLVEGEIKARSVQIGGKVMGNVHGVENVEVLTSGRLEGDMVSPQVHIAEGAFFTGKIEMTSQAGKSGAAQPAKPSGGGSAGGGKGRGGQPGSGSPQAGSHQGGPQQGGSHQGGSHQGGPHRGKGGPGNKNRRSGK